MNFEKIQEIYILMVLITIKIKKLVYYLDDRVLLALEKSPELMDILTFVKEVNFEIKDNLGFDVLWDSMMGKQCLNVEALLLEWLGP
jgi:hypothetical protein